MKNIKYRKAGLYNLLTKPFEKKFSQWRPNLTEGLSGYVLEIGTGTGANIKYYPYDCKVVAIDINLNYLKEVDYKNIIQMDAESLSFKDRTFDFVIAPLCFCSIPDPIKALSEVYRVLKQNGELRMIEHVKSNKSILSTMQKSLNPLNKLIFGCELTRETPLYIQKAGFKIDYQRNLGLYDVFREIRAIKE